MHTNVCVFFVDALFSNDDEILISTAVEMSSMTKRACVHNLGRRVRIIPPNDI